MLKIKEWLKRKKATNDFKKELNRIIQEELEKVRNGLGVKSITTSSLEDMIKEEVKKAKGGKL